MRRAHLVIQNGNTGLFARANDQRAMQSLAADPALRRRMGHAARERYLKLFAPHAVLSMLVDTYARVAGRNGHVSQNGHHPWLKV